MDNTFAPKYNIHPLLSTSVTFYFDVFPIFRSCHLQLYLRKITCVYF